MAVITEVDNLEKYLKKSKFIGIGTTAKCYLMPDGNVIKIFRNTYNKRYLFSRNNIFNHFVKLCELDNDSFRAPHELLIKNDEIIGYIYPYVEASTFLFLSKNTKIKDILKNYKKLLIDTKEISDKNFKLFDTTNRNILFNDYIYVIDIDKGSFLDEEERKYLDLYKINISKIIDTFLRKVFGINNTDIYNFYNFYLMDEFRNINWLDENSVFTFFDILCEFIDNSNPTINQIRRKMLVSKEYNTYSKPF